jgi:methylenetetrahydrofolate reductase (NADPH)
VVNGLMFWLAGSLLEGFVVSGFWPGVFGAMLYSIISSLLSSLLPTARAEVVLLMTRTSVLQPRAVSTANARGRGKAARRARRMALLKPSFFSVTFGAGGSTRDRTLETVLEIQREGHQAAPHLSCIGSTRESIRSILEQYRAHGIRHLVALRGDLPSGMARPGTFRYANELVEFIRAETGDWFHIEVAAYPEYHPQAKSPQDDLQSFKRKLEAGANSAITQYFYNFDAYAHFIDECQAIGIDVPIVPGIMPISPATAAWHASPTTAAPRSRAGSGRSSKATATIVRRSAPSASTWSPTLRKLLASGAPGLHFYTLNQDALTSYPLAAPWPFRNASGRLRGSGRNWLGRRLTIPRARRAASVKGLFGAWSPASDYFEAACKTITRSDAVKRYHQRLTARRPCSFTLTETLRPRQSTSFVTFRKPTKRFRMPPATRLR